MKFRHSKPFKYLFKFVFMLLFILYLLEYARLNVWILDGDGYHKDLLKYVITPEGIRNIIIVIVVDISKPWTIIDSLEQWTRILREHLHTLKLSAKELNEIEETCKFFVLIFIGTKILIFK